MHASNLRCVFSPECSTTTDASRSLLTTCQWGRCPQNFRVPKHGRDSRLGLKEIARSRLVRHRAHLPQPNARANLNCTARSATITYVHLVAADGGRQKLKARAMAMYRIQDF